MCARCVNDDGGGDSGYNPPSWTDGPPSPPLSDSDQPNRGGGFVGPNFSKCAQFGSTQDLAFVSNHYDDASAEAAAIQSMMPSQVQANQTNLTDAFLDWSAVESGWGGSPMATGKNNYFGYGSFTFPNSMTWGAELAYILSAVPSTKTNPNPSGLSYGNYLVQTLISNPSATPSVLLQAIANAGYNSYRRPKLRKHDRHRSQ